MAGVFMCQFFQITADDFINHSKRFIRGLCLVIYSRFFRPENRLGSIRPETRVFQKSRHPGEGRDPGNSAAYWIPAFAGMTEDVVYGRTLGSDTIRQIHTAHLTLQIFSPIQAPMEQVRFDSGN